MNKRSKFLPEWAGFLLWWLPLFIGILFFVPVEKDLVFDLGISKGLDWMEHSYLYLLLLVGSIFFPFILSFDKNVHFWKKWPPLAKANIIVAFFFILWDILFTYLGVWGFNDRYYIGWTIAGLPIEEWMWFFVIPYCCLFIYECLNFYLKKDPLLKIEKYLTWLLLGIFLAVGVWNYDHMYTSLTFFSAALITVYHLKYRSAAERSRFLGAWVVSIIPFYLVNGALTGAYTEQPVVVYSSGEFIGIRWGTIPLDDAVYLYVMLLWLVMLFEKFREEPPRTI